MEAGERSVLNEEKGIFLKLLTIKNEQCALANLHLSNSPGVVCV